MATSDHETNQAEMGISEIITRLKSELIDAQKRATQSGDLPMFRIRSVSIEVKFVLREIKDIHGGIDLRLVALKGSDKTESESINTIIVDMVGLESVEMGLLHERNEK